MIFSFESRCIQYFSGLQRGYYNAGQVVLYKAGQEAAYKTTNPLIWGAQMTPIQPLLDLLVLKL